MAEYKFRSTATSRHVILRHRRLRHPDMPSLVTGVYSEHMSSKLLDMESISNIDADCVAFSQTAIIVNHIYDLLKAVQFSSIYTQQCTPVALFCASVAASSHATRRLQESNLE